MTNHETIINPELEQLARNEDDDKLLDVVVELHESRSDEPSAAQMRESFSRVKEPVAEVVSELGGAVVDEAWINHTLRVQVPVRALTQLSHLDTVRALDVPHRLTED